MFFKGQPNNDDKNLRLKIYHGGRLPVVTSDSTYYSNLSSTLVPNFARFALGGRNFTSSIRKMEITNTKYNKISSVNMIYFNFYLSRNLIN